MCVGENNTHYPTINLNTQDEIIIHRDGRLHQVQVDTGATVSITLPPFLNPFLGVKFHSGGWYFK